MMFNYFQLILLYMEICLQEVMSLLAEFSPSIEIYSVDEAFIDFSGINQRHLIAENLITKIKKQRAFQSL